MQLEKQIRSSIILENKLLAREGKKLCSKCKDIFLIDDLISGVRCKSCTIEYSKEYFQKNKDKVREHNKASCKKHYKKNKEHYKEKRKEYREKNKEYYREYSRQYRLKKRN